MRDLAEIQKKYELTTSCEWQEIRKRILDHIVIVGGTQISPDHLQGMLYLVKHIDSWKQEFLQEKERQNKE